MLLLKHNAPLRRLSETFTVMSNVLFEINSTENEMLSQFSENKYSSSQKFIT